jgi:mono/diheme cytochrome c family protein
MRNFLLGFLTAVIVAILAGFSYLRLGFADPRADVPVSVLEQKIAMPSLDASVERHAPEVKNPVDPTVASLTAGMKLYQADCASCHGDIKHTH